MRQMSETFMKINEFPSTNEDAIRRRLGIDELIASDPLDMPCHQEAESGCQRQQLDITMLRSHVMVKPKSVSLAEYFPLSPSTTVLFAIFVLVSLGTVGIAAPMRDIDLVEGAFVKDEAFSTNDDILPNTQKHQFATKYFFDYGHLSTLEPTPKQFRNALQSFQDMAGLKQTGELDEATLEQMNQPRCGNSDISNNHERRKRFVYIARWEDKMDDHNVLRLKWYIHNYTKDIPRSDIKKTIRQAFRLWSTQIRMTSVTSLQVEFSETQDEEESDISIMWAEGDHGDQHEFDGPGDNGSNILAHTFYPNYQYKGSLNGDIHLDDFEQWNVNNTKVGASFPHVLVHEIGHSLGLGHSKKQQAIMYPIYRKDSLDKLKLDLDDKCAIHWSYVGASDLCLYIWLLSEVLPKKISIEKDIAYMVDNDSLPTKKKSRPELAAEQLKNTPVPLCRSHNNVQSHYEEMLSQRLQFPRELANTYSSVLCKFFEGLHKKYNSPTTENFNDVFKVRGAHNYFQQDERFESLEQANLADYKFDSDFFDWVITEFTK